MLTPKQIAQRREAGRARRAQVAAQVGEANVADEYRRIQRLGAHKAGRPTFEQTLERVYRERRERARYRPRTTTNGSEPDRQRVIPKGEANPLSRPSGTDNTEGRATVRLAHPLVARPERTVLL